MPDRTNAFARILCQSCAISLGVIHRGRVGLAKRRANFRSRNGDDLADLVDDMYTSVECLMDLNLSIARVLRKRNVIRFTTQDGGSATGLETDSSDQHSAHSRVKSAGDYEV